MKILKTIMDSYPDWFEDLRIIYDAEALFVGREITQKELIGAPLSNEEITQITKEEVDLAASADCVISVSDYERATFRKHGIGHCEVLGHSLPVNPASRSFAERTGFLFVGAIHEEASPNGDSMIWFLTEILPRIRRELGDAPFTIVGLNKSDRIRELAQENVRILGYMKDVQEFYNSARVFVAPTRYAAGIPHKVHEAAARGLPVVATPLLAKQLGWEDGNPFAVGVDAESFAQKCVELHTNQAVWERIRDAALSRIRTECSQAAFDAQLKRIFELVSKEPSTRFADVGMDR